MMASNPAPGLQTQGTKSAKDKTKKQNEVEEIDLEEIDDRVEALRETCTELEESQLMIFQYKIVSHQFFNSLLPSKYPFAVPSEARKEG